MGYSQYIYKNVFSIDAADNTVGYFLDKITAGAGITFTIVNTGAAEHIEIAGGAGSSPVFNADGGINVTGTVATVTGGLTFGDGDTGFYEYSDDNFRLLIGGAVRFYMVADGIFGIGSQGPAILNTSASATVPTLTPSRATRETGLGAADTDCCSLIATSVNILNVTTANTATGQVGIGTVNPSATLHVNGGVNTFTTGIVFGDGDSGFYEKADDYIYIAMSGANTWGFHAEYFRALVGNGARIASTFGSTTVPQYTSAGKINSGISVHTTGVSVIIDSVEGLCVNTSTVNFIDSHFSAQFATDPIVEADIGASPGDGGTATGTNLTDVCGTISLAVGGSSTTANPIVHLTFNKTYDVAPHVFLTPRTSGTAELISQGVWLDCSTDSFEIVALGAPVASANYIFDYFVIQSQ